MDLLVSVIVPVYNISEYLDKCVDSIIEQSYSNLEIILVDDGSTDGSGEKCDDYPKRDDRILVYHKENGGLSDARNFGIMQAHGDYYAFIDSDDAIHKDFFLELVKAQKQYDADIVSCDVMYFYDQHMLPELHQIRHNTKCRVIADEEVIKEYLSPQDNRIIYHGLCMKIYRKHLFNNLRFESGRLHEDLYITYQLLDKANKVVCIDCPYYFYFQRSNSICYNYKTKNLTDELEAYKRIYEHYKNQDKIKNELFRFLIEQYLEVLEKTERIKTMSDIKEKCKEIRLWIEQNIGQCKYYNPFQRTLILMTLKEIRINTYRKKIRYHLQKIFGKQNQEQWVALRDID